MYVPEFVLRQRLTLMVNRYEVRVPDAQGRLMAFAEQKRMTFREQVTFFEDDTKARPVFAFRARQRLDLNAGYDVTDESGAPLGFFRKDFGASLLRSTFHLEGPGVTGTGRERSMPVALLRRFTDVDFLPIHFDFVDPQGAPLISVERKFAMRDTYRVTVPDPRVDFRLAAAVSVAVDALMAR
ncbi:hypothetical protein DDE18_17725 [Nocardioides gansuensis]|uniref:Scramblase n=2 Tax=Nocardioides gansuensis TaxID=2138300 RepID=A0A2T8F6J3_9ACTN|nr:hypothetical protein DDE18_17725 [Nocardioides gansuensis]